MAEEQCPHCGTNHPTPFDPEILELARHAADATGDEKHKLMLALADLGVSLIDASDLTLPEELHASIAEAARAHDALMDSSFSLARMLLRLVGSYDEHRKTPNIDDIGTAIEQLPDLPAGLASSPPKSKPEPN